MQRPNKSDFAPPRRAPRFVPSTSLTVAVLEAGDPVAYGVVANISTGGVCMQSVDFQNDREFNLVLSFEDGNMLEATGRIVWRKDIRGPSGHAFYGLEFTELPHGRRASLSTLLESPSFVPSDA